MATVPAKGRLTIRTATPTDLPAIHQVAERSVPALLGRHYAATQLSAARDAQLYLVETDLIEDGTYYVLEVDGELVAGSGWTDRGTLHPPGSTGAGNHQVDATTATMRATYVDPRWARRGFATLLARVTETAATTAGYRRFEAMCTPPSEALRRTLGYQLITRIEVPIVDGISMTGALMRKQP